MLTQIFDARNRTGQPEQRSIVMKIGSALMFDIQYPFYDQKVRLNKMSKFFEKYSNLFFLDPLDVQNFLTFDSDRVLFIFLN